jgi:methylenetetrahydrofolate reductase (NADPH)
VVAGDPPQPEEVLCRRIGGHPYRPAREIWSAPRRHLGLPEGHSEIGSEKLWQAKLEKQAAILDMGHDFAVVTQFGFDAEPILSWLEQLRKADVHGLVRVGVPGPASVKTLLRFAARCGVGTSAKVMSKYGASITRLLTTAGPDALIKDLALGLDPARHGEVLLHFYPFGGLKTTAEWARDFARAQHA